MIVIADTSPLCYLLLIGHIDLLPQLYGRVFIPQAVADELAAPEAPAIVQSWIANPPDWLQIRSLSAAMDAQLSGLGLGEGEAIAMAEQFGDTLIVLDDMEARLIAIERGLNVTGLLGVLSKAAKRDLIDLPAAIALLKQTTFRASSSLIQSLLEKHR